MPAIFSLVGNLDTTLGAFLIGSFASAMYGSSPLDSERVLMLIAVSTWRLFGATCLQAFYYFMTYSDRPLVRMTVVSLVVLEMGQVAVIIHIVYHYLITDYANPVALLKTVWSIDILLGLVGCTVTIVQLSYAFRIYHVSGRKKLIPILIVIVSFAHFSAAWLLVASLFRLKSTLDIVGFPETIGNATLSIAAANDITIASTLTYYLHKNRTGLRETDRLINRLIKITINNGVLTSVMDLIALSLIISRPRDYFFFSVILILASLYSNSLLATFNSRRSHIRDQGVVTGSLREYPSHPLQAMNISGFIAGETSMTGTGSQVHDVNFDVGLQDDSRSQQPLDNTKAPVPVLDS